MSDILSPVKIGHHTLKNRLVRAATYEGMADAEGIPKKELGDMYEELSQNEVALIITGFSHISKEGRAMQPFQCGIDSSDKIEGWKKITERVHKTDTLICMQIAHTGRQAIPESTGGKVYSPSNVRCTYFRSKPTQLTNEKIEQIIEEFATAAKNAMEAGFDGVQIHSAHGYLIHQFFSNHTNRRKDKWGGSHENRFRFCKKILKRVREECGPKFLVLMKLSSADDRGLTSEDATIFAKMMEETDHVDAIEISYGTMEFAVNIIRGGIPLKIVLDNNPLFAKYPEFIKWLVMKFYYPYFVKRIHKFEQNYNLDRGREIMRELSIPVFLTGGIRSKDDMELILAEGFAGLSLSRPFLSDPDLVKRIRKLNEYESSCTNCNICTMYCDSTKPIKCFTRKK